MRYNNTNSKTQKVSQLKNTVVACIYDLVIILFYIGFLFINAKQREPYNVETFDMFAHIMQTILLLFLGAAFLTSAFIAYRFALRTEKDDELSLLHKYKAGYISKTISIILFSIIVLIIKDFSFFTAGNIFDILALPIIALSTSNLISNIIFIILEKFQLD